MNSLNLKDIDCSTNETIMGGFIFKNQLQKKSVHPLQVRFHSFIFLIICVPAFISGDRFDSPGHGRYWSFENLWRDVPLFLTDDSFQLLFAVGIFIAPWMLCWTEDRGHTWQGYSFHNFSSYKNLV